MAMLSAVLWFSKEECDLQDDQIIFWQQFRMDGVDATRQISLPELVLKESDHWKPEYLQWLDNLGRRIYGENEADSSFVIAPGLNYWWMTLPIDPSFSKDSLAYTVIRLWAFEKLASRLNLKEVKIYGADSQLVSILLAWGSKAGVKILIHKNPSKLFTRGSVLERLRTSNAFPILTLFGLGALLKNLFKKDVWGRIRTMPAGSAKSDLVLVDYFANLSVDEDLAVKFQSNYWGKLPATLAEANVSVHWVHIYVRTPSIPHYSDAKKMIEELNKNNAHQVHSLLQERISFRVLFEALKSYLRIVSLGLRIDKSKDLEFDNANNVEVSQLIWQRLRRAHVGAPATQNALWMALFGELLRNIRSQGPCLYLMENQPWEFALLLNWRLLSHERIYGVPHSAIHAWDLRYAAGSGSLGSNSPPRPDRVFVNGSISSRRLLENGVDSKDLHDVEALRYIGIRQRSQRESKCSSFRDATTHLLVFGEYQESMVSAQIDLLNSLLLTYAEPLQIIFRPHPAATTPKALLDPRIRVDANSPLSQQLEQSDVGFCGSVSSALVDILVSRTPAIVLRDGSFLNGQIVEDSSVQSVSGLAELISALRAVTANGPESDPSVEELFDLNPHIPKWKGFLSSLNRL